MAFTTAAGGMAVAYLTILGEFVRVTASASLLITLRGLLSDVQWDRFVGGSFPQPGAA